MRKGAFLLGGSLKIDRFELLRLAFTQGITPCRTRIMWKFAVDISLSPEGANSPSGGGGTPLVLFASGGLPRLMMSPLLRWKVAGWGGWLGLKDQCCFRSNRFSDSDGLASLGAFASELSAESLVALAADNTNILCHILASFSVSCNVVELRRVRLFAPVPIVSNETNRTAHVAAFKSCGEFLLAEGLPASGASSASRHCFLLLPLFICVLVPGGGGYMPSVLPHQRKNPTR
nr:MAG TPA: hypothetical protein [Caudoviricetes sp.]